MIFNKVKTIFTLLMTLVFAITNAQNLNSTNGGYDETRMIEGKKFLVEYYEYEIDKSMTEIWDEVAGNFVNVGKIHQSINSSHCLSGDTTEGIGAARFCSLDFSGTEVLIEERVIEIEETEDRKEFTYEVYKSKGFPAKVYNSWVVRKGKDGKIYLGNVFILRGNMAFLSKMMMKRLVKLGGVRNAVLAYKHYLETGEKKVNPEIFDDLYPEI